MPVSNAKTRVLARSAAPGVADSYRGESATEAAFADMTPRVDVGGGALRPAPAPLLPPPGGERPGLHERHISRYSVR